MSAAEFKLRSSWDLSRFLINWTNLHWGFGCFSKLKKMNFNATLEIFTWDSAKIFCSNIRLHLKNMFCLLTVDGHSIYVRNLPLNVTVAQLEEEFKKFGPIKPGGIQVRNNKVIMVSTNHSNYALYCFFNPNDVFLEPFLCLCSSRGTVSALSNTYH